MKKLKQWGPVILIVILFGGIQYLYSYCLQQWNTVGELSDLKHLLWISIFSKYWVVWVVILVVSVVLTMMKIDHHRAWIVGCVVAGMVLMLFLPNRLMTRFRVQNSKISVYDLLSSISKDEDAQETLYMNCVHSGFQYLGTSTYEGLTYASYTDGKGISTVMVSEAFPFEDEDTVTAYTIYKNSGLLVRLHTE